jgi:Ala-tRNA(Pro) deacylase
MDIAPTTTVNAPETKLFERLNALGIPHKTFVHPPCFTVEESNKYCGHVPGVHTKNLFIEDKTGGLWLVVARDNLRVHVNELARQLGAPRFSFGSPELLLEALGVPAGSVTPFAIMNDTARRVRVVLDKGMMEGDPLNFHPLRNDQTTAISAGDLLRFLRDTGREPMIVTLPERTP